MSNRDAVLVTGARGFIGAWVVKNLLAAGRKVVALDQDPDRRRLAQVLEDDATELVTEIVGDITNPETMSRVLADHSIGAVIHLAALQVPACAANPPLGALVNVVGTTNVLVAARDAGLRSPVVYASSVAALSPNGGDQPPSTMYGIFKRANEGTAYRMWHDEAVASIGIRPHTGYGVGRDQGLTSGPTKAMLHAAAGRPYHIAFGGSLQMQHGQDLAGVLVAAADSAYQGATVLNLSTVATDVPTIVACIEAAAPGSAGSITFDETPLPFPPQPRFDDIEPFVGAVPETPLEVGVDSTIRHFERLLEGGQIEPPS
ncbi:MAG: NAD-dependent epimerase/dehydratase family protein [Acidimicrobiia bacterium]